MAWNKYSLGDLAGWISSIILVWLVVLAVTAVFMRYVAEAPLAWAEEMEQLSLLWIILTGAVFAKSRKALLRVDILYNLFPAGARRVLSIFQELVHCVIFGLMVYYGYKLAAHVGAKTMPLTGIRMFWLYLSLPVGACGMGIITLIQLWELVTGREEV